MDWQGLLGGGVLGTIIIALINKMLNRKKDDIESIRQIIEIESNTIKDLEQKVKELQERLTRIEKEGCVKDAIMNEYMKCTLSPDKCPVKLRMDLEYKSK